MKKNNLLVPLRYRHYFGQALTVDELWFWQYRTQLKKEEIKKELQELINKGLLKEENGYYFLKHFSFSSTNQINKRREAKRKVSLAQKRLDKLNLPAEILFLGLSGSVAAGYADLDDDLDLVVITQKNSLWWSRFLLYILNPSLPRRHPGQKSHFRDLFCLNLWLDLSQLSFPPSLYVATELLNVIPLLNQGGVYNYWLKKNKWLHNFFPQAYKEKMKEFSLPTSTRPTSLIVRALNLPLFLAQLTYMSPKMQGEKVSLHSAFFHRHDYSQIPVLNLYDTQTGSSVGDGRDR